MASQREQAQAMTLLNEDPEVALSYARQVLKVEGRKRSVEPEGPSEMDLMWRNAEDLLVAQATHLIHVKLANMRSTHLSNLAPLIERLEIDIKAELVRVAQESS